MAVRYPPATTTTVLACPLRFYPVRLVFLTGLTALPLLGMCVGSKTRTYGVYLGTSLLAELT